MRRITGAAATAVLLTGKRSPVHRGPTQGRVGSHQIFLRRTVARFPGPESAAFTPLHSTLILLVMQSVHSSHLFATRNNVPEISNEYLESAEGVMNVASVLPPAERLDLTADCQTPILVADDDADDLFFIERLIQKTGVKNPIKTFNDGSEVVNYLGARLASPDPNHHRPGLLFLDLRMAGLGGFGFLQWAREQKRVLPLTMVVLSNSRRPADMAQARSLGAHRYLVKYPCVQTMSTIVRSVHPFTLA